MSNLGHHRLAAFAIAVLFLPSEALSLDRDVDAFLEAFCQDCHANGSSEGGFDVDALKRDLSQPQSFTTWQRIFDRVTQSEMPPEDASQPSKVQQTEFGERLGHHLREAHAERKATTLRRLNRREYENTLNDLFGTHLNLSDGLPEDGRSHEFDNIGQALSVSSVQIQAYLDSAEKVLDAAIAKTTTPDASNVVRASYAETREAEKFLGKQWLKAADGAVVFFRRLGYPTGMLRDANVRQSGFYKVRVNGYAYQSSHPVTFSVGATTFQRGADHPTYGYFEFSPGDPATVELEVWIENRYMIQIEPYGISDSYAISRKGIENYDGPGLAINYVEIEGPITREFPSRGHRLIFDGMERREVEPRNPNTKKKSWYVPEFEIVLTDIAKQVEQSLSRVASAAMRRPVTSDEVGSYVDLFNAELAGGSTIEESLRTAVSAILCSSDFLFLRENAGVLDDFAIASRLSYFLTRTTPDETLLSMAAAGELTGNPEALRIQTERLINDKRFTRFIEDFADAWLDLRNLHFTSPDSKLYPEFDPFLRFSMAAETHAFLHHLIKQNLPVSNLIKSDFAMLNRRLAEHYGIDEVTHPDLRPVKLAPDSVRGGLLSQTSVLKVSANGTNTSPVVRGVWVMERILGEKPPPPPPGIAGVEPDIRGATTLRELLEKHRDLDTCRSCHQVIDPPGFALESFDPIGGWRERFRSIGGGDPVKKEVDGRKVRYRLGQAVDSTCQLPDGRRFSGYREFRDYLASQQDVLAKTLATKLLTFASGREMGFSDRDEIRRIVQKSRSQGYGIRDLIHLIVESEIFRHK